MAKHIGKRGDTLIEVMLAVGIFSMVAIAVVAVMSGGTSSAQTALETTLAREEIDAQAEALRFIQSAYIADKNAVAESKFGNLWNLIKNEAIDISTLTEEQKPAVFQYAPTSCQDMYNDADSPLAQHGFVLDIHALGTFEKGQANDVIAKYSEGLLSQSSTYPHLVYTNGETTLVQDETRENLLSAEGIFIIAVGEPSNSTYYDFYIRTCWYGTGDQNPSTISTVMRLYDPDAIGQ